MELGIDRILDIGITHICNFSCDYCIAGSNVTSSVNVQKQVDGEVHIAHRDLRNVPLAKRRARDIPTGYVDYIHWLNTTNIGMPPDWFIDLDLLTDFLRTHARNWIIGISGGEPLRYPHIDKWLQEISKTHRIILLTNLSLIESNKSILDIPSDRMFYRVGFHPDYRSIDRFLKHLSYIRNTKPYIVNYVLHPRHIHDGSYAKYLDMFNSEGIAYEVTRFEGTYNGIEYSHRNPLSDEESMIIHEARYVSPPQLDSNIIGKSYAIMRGNGRIYECNECTTLIGNLYQDWFNPQSIPHNQCFNNGCNCSSLTAHNNISTMF